MAISCSKGSIEQLPANQGGIDRRGFEWFYWQRKMSSGRITLGAHDRVEAWRSARTDSARLRQLRTGR